MLKKTLIFSLSFFLVGLSSEAVFASSKVQVAPSTNQQIKLLSSKAEKLEIELQDLQAEVKSLQESKHFYKKHHSKVRKVYINKASRVVKSKQLAVKNAHKNFYKFVLPYSHGISVVTSPFLGVRDVYSVYDLIANLSSMNQDLHLLEQRQRLENYAKLHNYSLPDRPQLDLSGSVEGQVYQRNNFFGTQTKDIDLSYAQLDLVAEASRWATAAAFFSYDKYAPLTGTRVSNSAVRLSHGFLTIGNLNKFPVYFSIGQLYVPFGTYSNYMITTPVTKTLARVKTRAAVLGFKLHNGLYGSGYTFRGDVSVDGEKFAEGLNFGWKHHLYKFGIDLGGGLISEIANAGGMQYNGMFNGFTGFSSYKDNDYFFPGHEILQHHVPGGNLHFSISYNPFTLVTEYVTALRSFDPNDLTFNAHGAHPAAFDTEGVYYFTLLGKNSSFSLGAGVTRQALALNIPQQSYYAAFSTNLWHFTIESIEFRHDRNYSKTDFASGAGLPVVVPPVRDRNLITAQIGVYF